MSIKDITLSNTNDSNQDPVSVPVPEPISFEEFLQTNKGPISTDPQSGSILKILANNGFKEKIEEGVTKGHLYTILHSAPSPDFTLIDSWNETTKDDAGNTITIPRKTYQFFKIVIEEKPTEPKTEPSPTEEPVIVLPVEPNLETSVETVIPMIAEIPTVKITMNSNMAEEVANKIKRGGAGMTAEDWQYRNENWPAIEKFLAPKAVVPPAQPPTPSAEISNLQEAPANNSNPQHYDSKAWLMQKLGRPASSSTPETPQIATASATRSMNSFELLKNRFAQSSQTGKAAPAAVMTPEAKTVDASPVVLDQKINQFITSIFGSSLDEWNIAKTIPARAFIYPTEYAWGTDESGNPITRSLENYPPHALKLREKIAEIFEELHDKGTDIEKITVNDALTKAVDTGMIFN